MSILNSELDSIRQTLLELNSHLDQISTEIEQQSHNERDDSNSLHLQKAIEDSLRLLNNKLNSLPLTNIDDQSIRTFYSTLNQFESTLLKMQIILSNNNIISVSHVEEFNRQLNSLIETAKHSQSDLPIFHVDFNKLEKKSKLNEDIQIDDQTNFYFQSSINLQFLEEKLDQLKTVYYERHE
ncbi:unnamed protein product [Didymodactylos carnosus]|uniref:Uncharacterized protein n=1 Tax=Didymodactylos carnosus TaxID=1234261 RepID=A0A8S2TN31_9BILA|nr:unnamed protein product [Didymodactylos carnosus]CAF4292350.1 unnamed protein product [Didymodactylos carnosus]